MTALDKEKLLKTLEQDGEMIPTVDASDMRIAIILAINGTYWKIIAKIREGVFDLEEQK